MAHSTKLIFWLLFVTLATCVIAAVNREESDYEKRAISTTTVGFNFDEKKAIVEKHNQLRLLPISSNMIKMIWDSELERTAQIWANRCTLEHTSLTNRSGIVGYGTVGENIYVNSASFDAVAPVQYWYDEVKDYVFSNNTCATNKTCGHYTQVVWADSRAIGCGIKYCDKVEIFNRSGYVVVCQYGSAGNQKGVKPYKTGGACLLCPPNKSRCVGGLCE